MGVGGKGGGPGEVAMAAAFACLVFVSSRSCEAFYSAACIISERGGTVQGQSLVPKGGTKNPEITAKCAKGEKEFCRGNQTEYAEDIATRGHKGRKGFLTTDGTDFIRMRAGGGFFTGES
jgi:hypothetical protein